MKIIFGLGNPGPKFQKTRHNIGFRVVDELRSSPHFATARVIDEFAKENNFPKFKFSKKFAAEISEGILDDEKIVLAKPQTFMNLSGKSVKPLIENWKLEIGNLFVVHDDIDLPLGKIKIAINRGAAGHKGVESIIKEIKTKNFVRFRIGIQPKTGKPKNIEKFVLQKPSEAKPSEAGFAELRSSLALRFARADEAKSQRPFNKDEEKIVKEVIKKTVEAIEIALKEGIEKAMSRFNI